jgi:hypothetical protein
MKIFNLDKNFSIVCDFVGTRNGFKHTAILCRKGQEVYETKICYLNRTWECFEFESVLLKVIDERFTGKELEKFRAIIKNKGI